VVLRVDGPHGGTWTTTRQGSGWTLADGASDHPSCDLRTTVIGSLRLFTRDPRAELEMTGDAELGRAVAAARAIL
jgi:hypothetical protein